MFFRKLLVENPQKFVLILGVGKTGQAAHRFFEKYNIKTLLFDDKIKGCINSLYEIDFSQINFILQSPGVPFDHSVAREAKNRNLPIFSDVDIFIQAAAGSYFVGITGTNGKSTTTALIGHILKKYFKNVIIGGNIGTPVLDLPLISYKSAKKENLIEKFLTPDILLKDKQKITRKDFSFNRAIYVLELSSFQLALSHSLNLDRAVWINLTEDHLDKHGSLENYIESKRKIFNESKVSIIGIDDVPSQKIYQRLRQEKKIVFSISTKKTADFFVNDDGNLIENLGKGQKQCFNVNQHPCLLGVHNWQNMALAYVVARSFGISDSIIQKEIQSFQGLPHRLEIIGEWQDIIFVNDSKATNAESTIKALCSFKEDSIFLIAGGRAKHDGLSPAIPFMKDVQKVFLVGEASQRFSQELKTIQHIFCDTIQVALEKAFCMAQSYQENSKRKIILLSPACASFDQFKSYEERGDIFRTLVKNLIEQQK